MTADGAASDVTVRCLIADDQAMVREGFAAVLTAQPGLQVVGRPLTAPTRCARRSTCTPTSY
jgi:DNA-binding NarL/FixJ family response regulator